MSWFRITVFAALGISLTAWLLRAVQREESAEQKPIPNRSESRWEGEGGATPSGAQVPSDTQGV